MVKIVDAKVYDKTSKSNKEYSKRIVRFCLKDDNGNYIINPKKNNKFFDMDFYTIDGKVDSFAKQIKDVCKSNLNADSLENRVRNNELVEHLIATNIIDNKYLTMTSEPEARKKDEVEEEIPVAVPEKDQSEKNNAVVVPTNVNKNWFQRHPKFKRVGIALGGAAVFAGLILGASKLGSSKKTIVNNNTDKNTEMNFAAENAIENVSYEEAISEMSNIKKQWDDLGYKNVSQEGINSLYFITNYNLFDEDTVSKMINNKVVSKDAMVVVTDSLEPTGVCQDQGDKYVMQMGGNLFDMSVFCHKDEDKKILKYAYNQLEGMKNAESEEEGQKYFDSYYNYICNDENTDFSTIYNENSKGVNYLLNQSYGGVFTVGGAKYCSSQEKIDYLENVSAMNDFSSVIKEMQRCLSIKDVTDIVNEKTR